MVHTKRNNYENYEIDCMCSARKTRKIKKRKPLSSRDFSPNKFTNSSCSTESLSKTGGSTFGFVSPFYMKTGSYNKSKRNMCYSTHSINETGLRCGTPLTRNKTLLDSSAIDLLNIPESDRRILEILALKKEQEIQSEKLAHESHILWEKSQNERTKAENEQKQRWQKYVREKRKCDSIQNIFRMEDIKQSLRESQINLESRLSKRDEQVTLLKKKCKEKKQYNMKEKHDHALLKKAIIDANYRLKEDEVEEFFQKHLEELEEKLSKAESIRRNRQAQSYRRIASANRSEDLRHQENMLDLIWEQSQTKHQKEKQCRDRESRARERQIHHKHKREKSIKQARAEAEERAAQVRHMHQELSHGLEAWQDQVLLLQWADHQRAEATVTSQLESRRMRVSQENRQRQQQHQERINKVREAEILKRQSAKETICAKEQRIQWLQRQREREIHEGRAQAQMTAELRDHLRRTLSPDTFDRKVARAALETRMANRPVTASPSLLSSHIRLG